MRRAWCCRGMVIRQDEEALGGQSALGALSWDGTPFSMFLLPQLPQDE